MAKHKTTEEETEAAGEVALTDGEANQPAPEEEESTQQNFATLEEAMVKQNELATEEAESLTGDTAPESEFEPADAEPVAEV
jgi:hypothetical protein